jgi:galactonate dehydratase
MGPLQVVAGAHVMMTVPNFYRLEHSTAAIPSYNAMLTEPIDFFAGEVRVSGKPGLGVDLNLDAIQAHLHPDWKMDE